MDSPGQGHTYLGCKLAEALTQICSGELSRDLLDMLQGIMEILVIYRYRTIAEARDSARIANPKNVSRPRSEIEKSSREVLCGISFGAHRSHPKTGFDRFRRIAREAKANGSVMYDSAPQICKRNRASRSSVVEQSDVRGPEPMRPSSAGSARNHNPSIGQTRSRKRKFPVRIRASDSSDVGMLCGEFIGISRWPNLTECDPNRVEETQALLELAPDWVDNSRIWSHAPQIRPK